VSEYYTVRYKINESLLTLKLVLRVSISWYTFLCVYYYLCRHGEKNVSTEHAL